jgi:nifR3 family TIM-barrel protein
MRIGEIEFDEKPVFLAPMEDVTDPSFRFICKEFGADMVYTEFISSDGLIRDGRKSLEKLNIFDYERPIGIQIYGHLLEPMIEAARIAESANPDLIDINFGCPVRKIAARGAGSGMMNNVPLMVKITEEVVKTVKLPVTVKTRLGYDEQNKNIFEIAERLQDVGIQALTIHGRTRSQMYKGQADWTLIGEVKNNPRMKIPIIGNGDIIDADTAKAAFDRYGVDAIMVGRATYGRPWIFKEIKHFLKANTYLPPLTIAEKAELAVKHLKKSVEIKGDVVGILEMRRHLSSYFKGLDHFKETRLKLVTSKDLDELITIIGNIPKQWKD